ncbi:MAG: OmpA family protein [Scytonematopsis contorta HA4267-MV1]|jgi:OOP family OmpA-OmpF porin|nr:OmpA family protein [Scytonematopsis contorta HA4267-MV1]
MSKDSNNGVSKETPINGNNSNLDSELNELIELRSILFGVEPTKLNHLYERIENPSVHSNDISRVLPEAIVHRSKEDDQLSEALVSVIEKSIDASVKRDENIIAEAIFPIIGSATRKAIATAFGEMLQSLNETLEHSLSPKSLEWRLEATRTGKSFAEIVLLRTLIYRVEQIFLIHKQTGLLLQHILAPQVAAQDPDLVSAMLTAIQDFVKDSFRVKKGEALQSLEFGELTIWIEEGPQAVLAGIIRGNAPQDLKLVFQDAIEKIHLKLGDELKCFTGETEEFIASRPYLDACLESRYKTPPKKNYTYAWALLGTIGVALGLWSFLINRQQGNWNAFLDKLNSQPGIVVIKAEENNGKYILRGMRDPLAKDPNTFMREEDINPEIVNSQWRSYISLEPELITQRARKLLNAPDTVLLNVDKNGTLLATGSASAKWISQAKETWHYIPGVSKFEFKKNQDSNLTKVELYKKQIEKEMLFFRDGTTEFIPGQEQKLKKIIPKIQEILEIAPSVSKRVRINIVGHADTLGTEETNIILSRNRANKVFSYFSSSGINSKSFTIAGVGTSNPLSSGLTEADKAANRRVSFTVSLTDIRN